MSDASTYDEVPYDSHAVTHSHPDAMATMAMLYGLSPPPVEHCRVLEFGCADGANLLPMAWSLPECEFVGIDLSPRQVADGQAMVDQLGVKNLRLLPLSILDFDRRFGQFDYIICHGVYSWVPPIVQDKILSICGEQLTPHGIAYISYNTYPGWHQRRMIREMMRFHVNRFDTPRQQVDEARKFLEFVIEVTQKIGLADSSTYTAQLQEEASNLQDSSDSYLLHEQLEEVNEPVYFHEFVRRAVAKGLQYLSEASLSDVAGRLTAETRQMVADWSHDWIEIEQYLDFLRNRTFRRTLLVREGLNVERNPSPAVLPKLRIMSRCRPASPQPDVHTAAVEKFVAAKGATLSSNNPLVKAALATLFSARPLSVPFDQLWKQVVDTLRQRPEQLPEGLPLEDSRALAVPLLQCCLAQLVEPHVYAPRMVNDASERPLASAVVRQQAAVSPIGCNLRHLLISLSPWDRAVVVLLDGTRDRAQLLAELEASSAGELLSAEEGQSVPTLAEALEGSLRRFAEIALLVA